MALKLVTPLLWLVSSAPDKIRGWLPPHICDHITSCVRDQLSLNADASLPKLVVREYLETTPTMNDGVSIHTWGAPDVDAPRPTTAGAAALAGPGSGAGAGAGWGATTGVPAGALPGSLYERVLQELHSNKRSFMQAFGETQAAVAANTKEMKRLRGAVQSRVAHTVAATPRLTPAVRQTQRPASLGTPSTKLEAWKEWTHGLGGNKPASQFDRQDRGKLNNKGKRNSDLYSKRKWFWLTWQKLVKAGFDPLQIDSLTERAYGEYHHEMTMTRWFAAFRKDRGSKLIRLSLGEGEQHTV